MGFICYHTRLNARGCSARQVWLSGLPGAGHRVRFYGLCGLCAVTGSVGACSAAMASVAVPEMIATQIQRCSWPQAPSAAAGTIGALIPPSILMISTDHLRASRVSQAVPPAVLVRGPLITLSRLCHASIMVRVRLNPRWPRSVLQSHYSAEDPRIGPGPWPVLLICSSAVLLASCGRVHAYRSKAPSARSCLRLCPHLPDADVQSARMAVTETLTTRPPCLIIAVGLPACPHRFRHFSGHRRCDVRRRSCRFGAFATG